MARTVRARRVGSWPGPNFTNDYIQRFCQSLTKAGLTVCDVDRPRWSLARQVDVLHIHWPEQVFWDVTRLRGTARAIAALVIFAYLRLSGVTLVWCVHNLEPHDAGRRYLAIWRVYAALLSYLVHGFVTLSPSTVAIARARFPGFANKPAIFIWHADYVFPPTTDDTGEWRRQRGIGPSQTVFAFIGRIRPYKGVRNLVESFRATNDQNLRLVIAGLVRDQALRAFFEDAQSKDGRILLDLRLLPEDDLRQTVAATDVVVLPFERILHSGSVIYALSCGTPVLTPAAPYAADLQGQLGNRWVRTYDPPLSAAELVPFHKAPGEKPDLRFLSISESGQKLKAFYDALRDARDGLDVGMASTRP
jgi:beta-1,4-mannosyltransferase